MAKLALVAVTSKYVEDWEKWAAKAKGEGVFWLNLRVPREWREKVQKLAQQGEAEFWLRHGGNIVVKADLLDVRWATSKEGIPLPEEWKDRWAPEPEKSAPTWLLLRNLHIVDEPYQSPYEAQKPTQGVFGVVLLEKIWRVAPGRGGEWWDECRENGCIVIGWNEAAEKAPNNDFRQLSRDELKDLFKQVYRGKGGSGGWSQVWRFVHEIQPGDIIVAKKKKKKKWDK
jgi:hypothetical protein